MFWRLPGSTQVCNLLLLKGWEWRTQWLHLHKTVLRNVWPDLCLERLHTSLRHKFQSWCHSLCGRACQAAWDTAMGPEGVEKKKGMGKKLVLHLTFLCVSFFKSNIYIYIFHILLMCVNTLHIHTHINI